MISEPSIDDLSGAVTADESEDVRSRAYALEVRMKAEALGLLPRRLPMDPTEPPPFKRQIKSGRVLPTFENVALALSRGDWLGHDIAFDDFKSELVISPHGTRQWVPFRDGDIVEILMRLERGDFLPVSSARVRECLAWVEAQNRIDTAQEWLENEVPAWDGTPRIERFLPVYFAADDTPYTRAVGLYAWTAHAGRIARPGCQADMVPTLVGGQGVGKTRGIFAIAPDPRYAVEMSLAERDADAARRMRGVLVVELAELRGMRGSEAEARKAFISRSEEVWVPKYREFASTFARRFLFWGSTNEAQFLDDPTGERRWLPVHIRGRVDVEGIVRDRLQMWAEARDRFRANGVLYRDAQALAAEVHEEFSVVDPWAAAIERWLSEREPGCEAPEFVRTDTVLAAALGVPTDRQTKAMEMRAATVLRRGGYTRTKRRIDGRSVWGWVCLPQVGTAASGGNGNA